MNNIEVDKSLFRNKNIEKIIKILGLNIGIGVIDTIIFSPGLLGIGTIGASAFETAFGFTAIIMRLAEEGEKQIQRLEKGSPISIEQ